MTPPETTKLIVEVPTASADEARAELSEALDETKLAGATITSPEQPERRFYRTEVTLIVLSEEPIPAGMEVEEITRQAIEGDFSMDVEMRSIEVTPQQMARLALEQGTEPGFFGLDEEGNESEGLL